jgi:hypothetical protein
MRMGADLRRARGDGLRNTRMARMKRHQIGVDPCKSVVGLSLWKVYTCPVLKAARSMAPTEREGKTWGLKGPAPRRRAKKKGTQGRNEKDRAVRLGPW